MTDFPFTQWESYFKALETSLSGSDKEVVYFPNYYEYRNLHGFQGDIHIMKQFLESGFDPQEGLGGFVSALLNGNRYANDIKHFLPEVFQMFLQKGAMLKGDCLFTLRYSEMPKFFEDEVSVFGIRATLIDTFVKLGMDIAPYYDWASIPATYWEEIPEETIRDNYKKACFMALKYTSDVLKKIE